MAALKSTPNPNHIAWRVSLHPAALLRAVNAILDRPGLTHAHARAAAVCAHLDTEARAQGCRRIAGPPKRWLTAEEYEAYRRETPGYRRDPEAHIRAAKKMSVAARKRRAKKAIRSRFPK